MKLSSKWLNKNVSYFWRLLFTTVLSGVLSLALVCVFLLPGLFNAAAANDQAREEQLLLTSRNWLDNVLGSAITCHDRVEKSDWLYDLYIDSIFGKQLNFDMADDIVVDLAVAVALEDGVVDHMSFRFDQDPQTIYTANGVYSNVDFYREQYPEKLIYYFTDQGADYPNLRVEEFQGHPLLVYCAGFKTVTGGTSKGEVMVVLDKTAICRKLLSLTSGEAAAIQILDRNRTVLWESRLFETDEALHYSEVVSGNGDYVYRIGILQSVFRETRSKVLSLTIFTILLAVVACSLISSRLARASFAPVKSLSEKYLNDDDSNQKNELSALSTTIEQIVFQQSEDKAALEQLRPLAQQRIIERLLSGSVRLGNPTVNQTQYCDLLFPYSKYAVVAVFCPHPQTPGKNDRNTPIGYMEVLMEKLLEHLFSDFPVSAYFYFLDENRYRILLNANSEDLISDSARQINANYREFFREYEVDVELRFGAGSIVDAIDDIYLSSEQAVTAMNLTTGQPSEDLVFYEEFSEQVNTGYYYPLSTETLLLRAIVENGAETAKSILNDIIETNRKRLLLSYNSHRLLYSNLCATIIRSAQSLGLTVDIEPEEHLSGQAMSLSVIQSKVSKMIDDVCSSIAKVRKAHSTSVERQIVDYINQNLYDPNLSLSRVADKFQKSAAYVSIAFKNVTGASYSDYINQARVIRATELLSQGNMSLESVCYAVGYVSLSTFRRNFSKYTKINPSEYAAEKADSPSKPKEKP